MATKTTTRKTATKKAAGIGDDAVLKATGKTWAEWMAILDEDGCRKMNHKEIVAHLSDKHGVGSWWRQMVTVGYEQARGLRQKHEVVGGFQVSRSKTIAVPVAKVFGAWKDKARRGRWLDDADITIRTAIDNRSLRITWVDGKTTLEVMFYPKGPAKTQVSVQHSRLKNEKEAERKKAYWEKQLARLQELLER
ncbi:MAG: DUF4287 domain-containing protein [Planctomycetes bacterium]|nr:DUF4287 domain-containing protein [Planctomycetota bacterium]